MQNQNTNGVASLFQYGTRVIRTVDITEKRWAVANDICTVLEIENSRDAVARLDPSDVLRLRRSEGVGSTDTFWAQFDARVHTITLISEDGATDLVLDSRKPEARKFRRFLTHEVWPAVRDHGGYLTPEKVEEVLLNPDTIIRLATDLKDERQRREVAEATNNVLEMRIKKDAPLVAKAEAHSGSNGTIHRQAFAREVQQWGVLRGIKVLHEHVYELLRRKGMLVAGARSDRNHATAHAVTAGWAWTKKDTTDDGHATATTYLHPKGQDLAWKWIIAHVEQFGTLAPQDVAG